MNDILKSDDNSLIKAYYDCMQKQLEGSLYQKLPDFYAERNLQMAARVKSIFQKNKNKNIVVLTGDDHYPYLLEYLRKEKISLLNLTNL